MLNKDKMNSPVLGVLSELSKVSVCHEKEGGGIWFELLHSLHMVLQHPKRVANSILLI